MRGVHRLVAELVPAASRQDAVDLRVGFVQLSIIRGRETGSATSESLGSRHAEPAKPRRHALGGLASAKRKLIRQRAERPSGPERPAYLDIWLERGYGARIR
jgi:hypothetical protein